MTEPPIKSVLESPEFTTEVTAATRARLEACLRSDPSHIMPKSRGGPDGPEVEAIQKALTKINATWPPDVKMAAISDAPGVYGQSTANAVRKYKEINAIQRTGQPMDDIVGRMTISRLDDELKNLRLPRPPKPPIPPPTPIPDINTLPVKFCDQNRKITLDGTTAGKCFKPQRPADWVNRTQATLDTIYANPLGKKIVDAIRDELIIKPYLEEAPNASSDGKVYIFTGAWEIEFTAEVYDPYVSQPGSRPDEVLLHEMIHMLEHNFGGYSDPADKSLRFDGGDFLTINGANIYSKSQSRGLRKDHKGHVEMPTRYATDAREHMILMRENYEKAHDNNKTLFDFFKTATSTWNPCATFDRSVTNMQFLVKVSADQEFEWFYELFSDSTARWRDRKNVAEYGVGTWTKTSVVEPPDLHSRDVISVDWKGGGFDRFPLRGTGITVDGTNKTGGVVHDSKVTQQF